MGDTLNRGLIFQFGGTYDGSAAKEAAGDIDRIGRASGGANAALARQNQTTLELDLSKRRLISSTARASEGIVGLTSGVNGMTGAFQSGEAALGLFTHTFGSLVPGLGLAVLVLGAIGEGVLKLGEHLKTAKVELEDFASAMDKLNESNKIVSDVAKNATDQQIRSQIAREQQAADFDKQDMVRLARKKDRTNEETAQLNQLTKSYAAHAAEVSVLLDELARRQRELADEQAKDERAMLDAASNEADLELKTKIDLHNKELADEQALSKKRLQMAEEQEKKNFDATEYVKKLQADATGDRLAKLDLEITAMRRHAAQATQTDAQFQAAMTTIDRVAAQRREEFAQEEADAKIKIAEHTYKALTGSLDKLATEAEKTGRLSFKQLKAVRIAEAVINTAEAITQSFSQLGIWALAGPAEAIAAAGILQIEAIEKTEPGSGSKPSASSSASASVSIGPPPISPIPSSNPLGPATPGATTPGFQAGPSTVHIHVQALDMLGATVAAQRNLGRIVQEALQHQLNGLGGSF